MYDESGRNPDVVNHPRAPSQQMLPRTFLRPWHHPAEERILHALPLVADRRRETSTLTEAQRRPHHSYQPADSEQCGRDDHEFGPEWNHRV
jgi:hypothetical protein